MKELYLRLCMTTVFRSVMQKELFVCFSKYVNSTSSDEKIRAYSAFVSEIYLSGLSLTDLVFKYVSEDENIYVRSVAKGIAVSDDVLKSANRELLNFQEFAALSTTDFAKDLGLDYVSPFKSFNDDFVKRYAERIENVNKLGYGEFSSYGMFRLSDNKTIEPILSADKSDLNNFVGYAEERQRVIDNTVSFIKGHPAANVLLCGDAGTGKSSTVKAVANAFFEEGIRLIELRKDQLQSLPFVMGKIRENPLKFIIFIDDLSFNRSDDNFSMLKAALEGSASAKSDNAVIYATSNRRHIIKESFSDRDGNDVHINDTLQETLSLSERFGLVVHFSKPNKQLYLNIVYELVERNKIEIDKDKLTIMAEAFALRKGNRSARCAEQFVDSLMQ